MQIEQLKAFCAIYENNSLSAAARQLVISTPMMTRHLQHIESELGVVLFHRSTRALNATEAGDLFYHQAQELIQQYDSSIAALKSLSTHVSGTLKIGLPASINQLWITPTLHKLCKTYPDLSIRLVNGNHLLDLLSEGFDVIIHCGALPDSGLYYQKLRDWHKITCATPRYLKKHGTPQQPGD